MDQAIELTLEQEFSLKSFANQVQQMSREQAQEFLVQQQRLMIMQKKIFQDLLKQEWKLDVGLATLQTEE
jgi:Phycobilisome degradation protein nblA